MITIRNDDLQFNILNMGATSARIFTPASVNFKMQRGLLWSTWLTFSYLQILLRLKPFRQDLRLKFKQNTCFHTFHILVNASLEW